MITPMIGELRGIVTETGLNHLILNVGGIGFRIAATPETLTKLREAGEIPVRLLTHLAVKEDALDLYGFLDPQERELFLLLISVSGIGPKSALAILSLAPAPLLIRAIAQGETDYLTRVSGIGKKNAGKIILELKDKMSEMGSTDESLSGESDILEALKSLGYSLRDAREALQQVPSDITDTSARIKAALKILSQSR